MQSNLPNIIAICGAKRSGKDILGDYFVKEHGYIKISFAEPLKQIVKLLFNFKEDQLDDSDNKDKIDEYWQITPRKALQFIGTEVMQYKIQELLPNIGRNFWIHKIKMDPDKKYIITDLRFHHEYEFLKKTYNDKLMVIKVIRPNQNGIDEHCSEEEFKTIPVDKIIYNDKTIKEFIDSIKFNDSLTIK